MNHHEVTNLLVDLPEDGPYRDSIFAIMQARKPCGGSSDACQALITCAMHEHECQPRTKPL